MESEINILVCACGTTREVKGPVASSAAFMCSICSAEILARYEAEIAAREQRAEARTKAKKAKTTKTKAKRKKTATKSRQDGAEPKPPKAIGFKTQREMREYIRARLDQLDREKEIDIGRIEI